LIVRSIIAIVAAFAISAKSFVVAAALRAA